MAFFPEDDLGLIKLFGAEPDVYDADSFVYTYKKQDNYGYELSLYSVLVDEFIVLTLKHKSLASWLYDLAFCNTKTVTAFENGFVIVLNSNIKHYVYFTPNFSLKMQLGEQNKLSEKINYSLKELCQLFNIEFDNLNLDSSSFVFTCKNENYIFSFSFLPDANSAFFNLKDEHLKMPIYEITIHNVVDIEADIINQRLLIKREDSEEVYQISFKRVFVFDIDTLDELNKWINYEG